MVLDTQGEGDDEALCALGGSLMIAGGVLFLEQVAECEDPDRLALLFKATAAYFSGHEPTPGIPFGFSRATLMDVCRSKKSDDPASWTPATAGAYGCLLKQLLKTERDVPPERGPSHHQRDGGVGGGVDGDVGGDFGPPQRPAAAGQEYDK